MSYDGIGPRDLDLTPLMRGRDPALKHVGDHRRILHVHRRHAALVISQPQCTPPLGPTLLPRIRDSRSMRLAIDKLAAEGPKATGPNGLGLENLSSAQKWALARALSIALTAGTYRPGRERHIRIPKEGKPGEFRQLAIQNVEDRIVAKSLQLFLRPVVDPGLSAFCFGTREQYGRDAALASAMALAQSTNSWCWIADDVADAFTAIPFSRFLDAARQLVPKDVVEMIQLVSETARSKGIRQGSPASPLFADMFFTQFIDHPWQRKNRNRPLFRYLDDLLVLCRDRAEAVEAHQRLSDLASSAGTPLKGSSVSAVCDLRAGQSLTWLGYTVQLQGEQPAIRIAPRSWDRLAFRFAKAHLQADAPLRALKIVSGWVQQMGPCFPFEDRKTVLGRLRELAASFSFCEMAPDWQLIQEWSAAHARWERVRQFEVKYLPVRIRQFQDWARPTPAMAPKPPAAVPDEPVIDQARLESPAAMLADQVQQNQARPRRKLV